MHRSFRVLLLLGMIVATKPADAQECAALSGRMRLACAIAKYPAFGAQVERCKDEARAMGLRAVRGDPGFKSYVAGCVGRRPAVARVQRNAITRH